MEAAPGPDGIRAIGFFATVAMCFLTWAIERRTALFFDAMDAHQDTRDSFGENDILEEYGSGFLRVYRVARGISKITQHASKPPHPEMERRPKKGECVQLRLKLKF